MTDNRTTELKAIMDEFEHECFMLRVEASDTRARDDVVRKAYERIRDEFAGRIAATLGSDRESELQSALNKAAGNWAKADALLRERMSSTLTAEQVRETVEKHWHDLSADYDMPEATALPEYSYDWQAIADELNARAERTCKFVSSKGSDYPPVCSACGYELGIYDCEWFDDGTYGYGGNYCPNCGCKKVDA